MAAPIETAAKTVKKRKLPQMMGRRGRSALFKAGGVGSLALLMGSLKRALYAVRGVDENIGPARFIWIRETGLASFARYSGQTWDGEQ